MMPVLVVSLPANDCDLLCNWASAYGAAVRQRTVRQETTMAKHGTLPEYLYQRHLEVGDKVNLNFGVDEDEAPHEDLNEREGVRKLVSLAKASRNLMKVVTKKLKSVQMTTILRASKMN